MKYSLGIPKWRPPPANAWRGRHWSIAHKLRQEATEFLNVYAQLQRIPDAKGRRRVSVEVALGPRQKPYDKDALDKLLLDALVNAGLLLDDSERGLEGRMEVTFRRGTAEDWGTTLMIEDMEEFNG